MHVPVILAMLGGMEIPIIVGAAILLFGGSKIRDVARGLGAAKKEFQVGQAEADIAAERARAEARLQAEANAAAATAAAAPAPVAAAPVVQPPIATPPVQP